jgi:parvulin-like peptidyl-prolyl isomerase
MTNKEEKKIKVEFAPGAFDSFEGTQEELDALQKEIIETFSNMSREELKEQSRKVDVEDLMEDPELARQLTKHATRNLH